MDTEYPGDESIVAQAVAGAADLAFSGAYVGVSYRDLARYHRFENAREGLTLDERDAEITQLYAALAVLVRAGMTSPDVTRAIQWVNDSGTAVALAERPLYGTSAFPYDAGGFPYPDQLQLLPDAGTLADLGIPELFRALQSPAIRHEWTVKAGKRLFVELSNRIERVTRSRICANTGLFGTGGHDAWLDVAKEVALALATTYGFDGRLSPIAATVAVILARRGLKEFCGRRIT